MRMVWPQKALADFNIAGPLNALMKPVQEMDTAGKWGQRNVLLSSGRHLLEGFSLNKNNPFDTLVRTPLKFDVNRLDVSASVSIPALMPLVNFFPASKPYCSIIAVLGVVPICSSRKTRMLPPPVATRK